MELSLGLPIDRPAALTDWGRRAEAAGFHALGLLDRLTYDNPEPMTALAVLAGATQRIRLQTEVLLAPLRPTALLAKQVATLDVLSGGRFSLGIGVGGRADDFAAAGVALNRRGRILDRQLAELRGIWRGEPYPTGSDDAAPVGPPPLRPGGPPILIGGFSPAALARVARHADGFLCAAPLHWAGGLVEQVREQWADLGRAGRPRLVCQTNVALGPPATVEQAGRAVADYYAFTGRDGWGAPTSDPAAIADLVAAYRDFGADELVLYCYSPDAAQVDRLAELLL